MGSAHETADATAYYDGVLRRPFLAEHWYKGFVAAALGFGLMSLLVYSLCEVVWVAVGIAGLFSLVLLTAVVAQQRRFEVDRARQRYRSCLWVLGLRLGNWQPLPVITAIKLRHRVERHFLPVDKVGRPATGFTANENKWQVLLRTQESRIGIVAAYLPEAQATACAARLADLFQVALLTDSTN